jgi:hypothetical protein
MKEQEAHIKSWEAGRMNLIEEHKFKRENERTHRAALYVIRKLACSSMLTHTQLSARAPRGYSFASCKSKAHLLHALVLMHTRHQSARKKSSISSMPRYTAPVKLWSIPRPHRSKFSVFLSSA